MTPLENPRPTLGNFLFESTGEITTIKLFGRATLLLALTVWGGSFMFHSIESNYVGESFLHLVNLPFHEAGHVIFSFFGRFLHVLGGTLGQLLMPLICMVVLVVKTRDPFGGAVALWWLAESYMDIAPYINDARTLELELLGGVTGAEVADYHDWEQLLGMLGILEWDHFLARLSHGFGIVLMVLALLWGGYLLVRQRRMLKSLGT